MKLIVGLGNPGPRYTGNRHNVGFQCLNYLARAHGLSFTGKGGQARLAAGRLGGQEVVLAKPQTYMNLSGKSLAALVNRYRLSLDDILMVHDDVDLPLGPLRIRPSGSAGGHRGLESIFQALGTQDIARLRVGIGRPQGWGEEGLRDYVLSDFTSEEKETLKEVFPRVSEAVLCVLEEGIEAAMNRYNA
ncbi:MAG: aminoacyl-tRNA hydrolase [Dehalococcoidia bacterium]|nr:aminoacyl-tRNA hydrolase [Dehalococcoidia bacterium]